MAFCLPKPLNVFAVADDDEDDICSQLPGSIQSTLSAVCEWEDFEEWISCRLQVIDSKVWSRRFWNTMPDDYTFNIGCKEDLNDVTGGFLLHIVRGLLRKIFPQLPGSYDFSKNSSKKRKTKFKKLTKCNGIGNFDFYFHNNDKNRFNQSYPLCVVETECDWKWPQFCVDDLVQQYYSDYDKITKYFLHRLFAYMSINRVKYGVVTTYNHTRIFRRSNKDPCVLEVSPVFGLCAKKDCHTVLGALVALTIQLSHDKFCGNSIVDCDYEGFVKLRPPLLTKYPTVSFDTDIGQIRLTYTLENRHHRHHQQRHYCHRKSYRSAHVYISHCEFLDEQRSTIFSAVIKLHDVHKNQTSCNSKILGSSTYDNLNWEVEIYQVLRHLQGLVIPEFLSFGNIWGIFDVAITKYSGDPLRLRDIYKRKAIGSKMINAIQQLHRCNVIHGNIGLDSFIIDDSSKVYLVGFRASITCKSTRLKSKEVDKVRRIIKRAWKLKRKHTFGTHNTRHLAHRHLTHPRPLWQKIKAKHCKLKIKDKTVLMTRSQAAALKPRRFR